MNISLSIIEGHTLLDFHVVFLRTRTGRIVSFVYKPISFDLELKLKESFLSDPILGPVVSKAFSLDGGSVKFNLYVTEQRCFMK